MEAKLRKIDAYASLAKINSKRMRVNKQALEVLNNLLLTNTENEMKSGIYSDTISISSEHQKLLQKNRILKGDLISQRINKTFIQKMQNFLLFFLR